MIQCYEDEASLSDFLLASPVCGFSVVEVELGGQALERWARELFVSEGQAHQALAHFLATGQQDRSLHWVTIDAFPRETIWEGRPVEKRGNQRSALEGIELAYLRGDTYIWSSGAHLHLWAHDGDDGWAESIWAEGRLPGASGVAVSEDAMDEFVVMRFAELVERGLVAAIADRALSRHAGNFGCRALVHSRDALVGAVDSVQRRR